MIFKEGDSVTLNYKQMNEMLELYLAIDTDKAKMFKLYINEQLYLKKIVELNKELETKTKMISKCIASTKEDRKKLLEVESKMEVLLSDIEIIRAKQYCKGM